MLNKYKNDVSIIYLYMRNNLLFVTLLRCGSFSVPSVEVT